MPALDQITVQPQDLLNIIDSVQSVGYNGPIKIIDTIQSYTIRDTSEGFLTEVQKEDMPDGS